MRVPEAGSGTTGTGTVMIKMSVCVVFTSLQPIVDVHVMDDVLTPGVSQP